jgi:hypothetical protein
MRIKPKRAYKNIRIYNIIIVLNFLHVSVTFCGHLQWRVCSKDILRRQPNECTVFYVLLTVPLPTIFVNNQLDAQFFFMYVYFYSLHVSGSHVPIIKRINWSIHLLYVTLYRWPFGVQVWLRLRLIQTCTPSIEGDIYQMSYWYN